MACETLIYRHNTQCWDKENFHENNGRLELNFVLNEGTIMEDVVRAPI